MVWSAYPRPSGRDVKFRNRLPVRQLSDQLFILLQHVLPKHLMTAIVFRIAAIRTKSIKNFLIRKFVDLYKVDTREVELPVPGGFDTFNDFFTRALASGAREIDTDADSIVSPVDGTVSAAGRLDTDTIFQAKGLRYSLTDLLMTDMPDVEKFTDGEFATIYLAPYNYHRVHCPLDATLVAARYVPGSLYSVSQATVSLVPNLFTRNERLICHFDSDSGPMILIFVGALHVGSITTPWTGRLRPRSKGTVQDLDVSTQRHSTKVQKGDLVGWFNMGSTVIVLLPPGASRLSQDMNAGKLLRVGQAIGRLRQGRL